MEKINIKTEYITLGQFLKLASIVGSGVDAKMIIQNGEVMVNAEIEIRRGRKLRNLDQVSFDNQDFMVVYDNQENQIL
jgi:Uncharacterized conserved protein